MSPASDIPEPWRTAMENAGTYSLRDLASKTGTGTSTVSDLIYGRKLTSERTLQVVADALRLPVTTIREWASAARGEERPFALPPEANRLSRSEREAILAVVRAMLDPGDEASVDGSANALPPLPQPTRDNRVDLRRLDPPDVSRMAARQGEPEGQHLRPVQDDDAEL